MIMVIAYSFVNQFWKQCWLLVIDYYLLVIEYQRVKLFGNDLWKLLMLLNVLKNLFLVLILIESSLDSWILILIILESWFLKLDYWILNIDSWNLILESWILILETWFLNLWNLLNSWFFGIIKIILEGIASTIAINKPCWDYTLISPKKWLKIMWIWYLMHC